MQELEHTTTAHSVTLHSEAIGTIGNFSITNTLFTGALTLVIIAIFGIVMRKRISLIPSKFQLAVESIWEYLNDIVGGVTGDSKTTQIFMPVLFSVFMFILINNWIGLLPGIGTIMVGETPLLRGATTDVNLTLVMSLFSIVASFGFGLYMVGGWNSINRFFNLRAFGDLKYLFTKPIVLVLIPVFFSVGILELVAEVVKVISLTFRLYGNVFAGEVLLHTIGTTAAFIAPVPFIFLELVVGAVQAFVFTLLTLVGMYIAASFHAHGVLGDDEPHHD